MTFNIVTDTAGSRVAELSKELLRKIQEEIINNFSKYNFRIGIGIRCLPDSYNRNSFVRYSNKDSYLTIDFCVSLEEYEKLYKIEQKFELGKTFLEWLEKGLENKSFLKSNPSFDKEEFVNYIIKLGKEIGWFVDEVDYSQDLEY
ncbi:Immunity protein 12 domain-containing protein [Flavobacterium branchiophilum]|uniref:Immunity protein 12 domain-containing protein n=1 Tax=Flavobacterium branchiophilum (strain FL-15) TaxID=1034807 RepID=G2Z5L9_FLABF|nr:hypothetical protein [Flavobacterium branchiophilum]CCB70817.1 Hypothetical protein FBFL15_2842 [Flavobacterium branchiophilum FL-15]